MSRPEGDSTLTARDRTADPRPPAVALVEGTKIGRYVIAQRIGAGGMGVVYSARDTELARDVALKIVRPRADVDLMEGRLRREAKAMARLSHPNVVPVFDIGGHDDQLFIAMELVAGETLRSWVTRRRAWRDVVQLFVKAARGLEAAHAAGLLHRDFKPDNVMVGLGDEPRITDFGLARELGDAAAPDSGPVDPDRWLSQVTATGGLVGTPAYMAPEQLLGSAGGARADQFSFCVSLFEVLHGRRPFHPATPRPSSLIAEIRAGRIVTPATRRAVPGWLGAAIARGLAFDPEQRWPSMLALAGALERGHRARRRSISGLVAVLVIVVAAGLGSQDLAAHPGCLEVAPKGNDAVTILVCKDEYTRASDPQVGARLADALRRTGKGREAAAVANELLATPVRADALYTLGKVAADEDRRDDAERALRLAGELHRDQHQWGDAAADLLALAGVSNDFVDQLVGLDQAVTDARRGANAKTEAYAHLAAARLLSEIGARTGALAEIERARPLVTEPSDRVRVELERGNVYQNLDDNAPAVVAFERARAGAEAATIARVALSARLNLVYSLAESGRLADAAAQLNAASALDPGDRKLAIRLALEARIAARGGDPARAVGLLERAVAATDPDATDDLTALAIQRAALALDHGELAAAEASARRAIAGIEQLRSTHPPVELRSWMVTDHRTPYEILFASLARRGDAAGALAVFEHYRGAGVLAGLAHGGSPEAGATSEAGPPGAGTPTALPAGRPASPESSTPPGLAFPIAELARLLPAVQTSALAAPARGGDAAVLDAVRAASLLALVVARGELWRITADGGRLQVARIGAVAALRPQLDRFRAAPADRAAAAALGDILVPPELARPSDRVLHVVLDEPLAWLPVAALRVGDRRLISARPIVRAARAAALGCAARRDPRRVVVIDTSDALARRISAVPAGPARASLFGAAPGDLLHIAVATERDELGDALVFRDGHVRALEIAGHPGAPAQVVLATPDAGPAGTASLAMAFVAAGADQVIATVRQVPAATIERFAERLYRGAARSELTDLVRALARIQTTGDGGDNDDWLGFAAFGRVTCNPQP